MARPGRRPARAHPGRRQAPAARGRPRRAEQERALTLVVDASAVVDAVLGTGLAQWSRLLAALERVGGRLAAPELLWSEATSVLHEAAWRGRLDPEEAREALGLVLAAPIAARRPRELRRRAWAIADRLGWARTYDAEYCALAELLGCDLVTADRRLRAAGERLGYVRTVGEAAERLAAWAK